MKLEKGHVAVVTGGASGIGLALATAFAKRGLHVVLGDIDEPALADARDAVAAHGVSVLTQRTDVSQQDDLDALAHATLTEFGRVDVLCNNAGTVGTGMPLWEFELVEWEWIIDVDVWGVVHGIRAFVPHLVEQGSGHVVNTSSLAGLYAVGNLGPYNAAKHAVRSISETLAIDLQQRAPGVGVTVLCPGPTETPLLTEGARAQPAAMAGAKKGVSTLDNPGTLSASGAKLMSADTVAEATLRAIEDNQLYLAPFPGAHDRIRQWTERIVDETARNVPTV